MRTAETEAKYHNKLYLDLTIRELIQEAIDEDEHDDVDTDDFLEVGPEIEEGLIEVIRKLVEDLLDED